MERGKGERGGEGNGETMKWVHFVSKPEGKGERVRKRVRGLRAWVEEGCVERLCIEGWIEREY